MLTTIKAFSTHWTFVLTSVTMAQHVVGQLYFHAETITTLCTNKWSFIGV